MKCKKTLLIILSCVALGSCFTGCGGNSGDKSIQINQLTAQMTLTKVNFYDFFNYTLVSNYSGTSYVPSNGLNSRVITFADSSDITRTVHVSTPLSNKPATVDVYTNYEETTYDTYTCTY